jgi:ribosome-binding factor A
VTLRRQKRIADVIQRELSDIVHRRVKDPRLEGVTITGTRVSPDYQYADVYFYRLGGDPSQLQEAKQGLESANGFIRRELGGRLTIRHTPALRFHLDESIDYGDHIEDLFSQIRQEREDATGAESATGDAAIDPDSHSSGSDTPDSGRS